MKKLLHGVGYNSGGSHVIRGGNRKSKVYAIWAALLQRCYSEKNKLKHPTYEGCYVCIEWHDFKNFAEWYVNHKFYGLGYHLDKDLLVEGNKVYSPQTCTLVPRIINNITLSSQSSRGDLPQGVHYDKEARKYKAQMNVNGKVKNLGRFLSSSEASAVYVSAKERHVKNTALLLANKIEWGVFINLMNWSVAGGFSAAKPDSFSEPNLKPFLGVK